MSNYVRHAFSPVPKDAKGTHRVKRVKQAMARENAEKSAKDIAKELDGRCRWPHAHGERTLCRRSPLHGAHVKAKGMGSGDKSKVNRPENIIACCEPVHVGKKSLHSGDRKVEVLDPVLGTRGPCRFSEKVKRKWVVVAEEISPHTYRRVTTQGIGS